MLGIGFHSLHTDMAKSLMLRHLGTRRTCPLSLSGLLLCLAVASRVRRVSTDTEFLLATLGTLEFYAWDGHAIHRMSSQ